MEGCTSAVPCRKRCRDGTAGAVGSEIMGIRRQTASKGSEKASHPPQQDVTNIQQQNGEEGGFHRFSGNRSIYVEVQLRYFCDKKEARAGGVGSWRRNGKIGYVLTLSSSPRRGEGGIYLPLMVVRQRTCSHSRSGGSRDERQRTRLRRSLQHPPASRTARNPSASNRKPSLDASDGLHRAKHCCSERFVLCYL